MVTMAVMTTTPDQRAARIAGSQHGLLTSEDATSAGLSPTQLKYRLAARGWARHGRGLYLLPGAGPPTWRRDAMAAVLLGGSDARASHLTSAALHGGCRPPVLPHITVPARGNARTRLASVHRSDVPPVDRATIDGVPCTSASRAVVECASLLDRRGLEELVDQVICLERASEGSIAGALGRAGAHWPGRALLTSVLSVWTDGLAPETPGEARFLRRLIEWGATGVVTQFEINDVDGRFVARVDVAIPVWKQAFEYDSDRFHGARRYAADELRDARIRALGWHVDHVSKRDLLPSGTRLRDLLVVAAARHRTPSDRVQPWAARADVGA